MERCVGLLDLVGELPIVIYVQGGRAIEVFSMLAIRLQGNHRDG